MNNQKSLFSNLLSLLGLSTKQQAPHEESVDASDSVLPASATIEAEATPPGPTPLDDEAWSLLKDIRKYAAWSGEDGRRLLGELSEAFTSTYSGHETEIAEAIAEGRADGDFNDLGYSLGSKEGPESPAARALLDTVRKRNPAIVFAVKKSLERGAAKRSRSQAGAQARRNGKPAGQLQPPSRNIHRTTLPHSPLLLRASGLGITDLPLHPNDLRAQTPSARWQIAIDESGDDFGPEAANATPRSRGRFVAVAVPTESSPLSLLPGWHAADCHDPAEIDRVAQAVLDAPVGVFGMEVTSLPIVPGERWNDGILALIDWILRLLPVDGPTRIEVMVENRGVAVANQHWATMARDSLRRLALAFPIRAGHIDLEIVVVSKNGCDWNGYVDAVAFTWGSPVPESRDRLRTSAWLDTCLLERDGRGLITAWDLAGQGLEIRSAIWWNLITAPENRQPASLVHALLSAVGTEIAREPRRWQTYLEEVRHHMASGPVDLNSLASAVDWMQEHQPEGTSLPSPLRLAWLTVQLANANHHGATESAWDAELVIIADRLMEESAPLVCHADLHRAVAYTNRFDFVGASVALNRWENQPIAVPGLRYWAQVRSSLGQHAAFQGRNDEAVKHFDEALNAFQRLSDPAVREKELSQTTCYRAIAMMDDPSASDDSVRAAIEQVTGPLATAVTKFASVDSSTNRYAHHLFLRWLVHRGDLDLRAAYLAQRPEWKTGHGHPWPLIQFYRALLIHPQDPAAARDLAFAAAELAFASDQGPVVRLIGACCRTVAVHWGEAWRDSKTEFDELEQTLPLAGPGIALLRGVLDKPIPPLELLSKVLPFNFR